MDDDRESMIALSILCEQMSADELRRMCEGTLRAASISQLIFRARFPEAWVDFNQAIEAGLLEIFDGRQS
jgi:hypothetical protein